MKKRHLAMVLLVFMVFSLFTGCSKDGEETTTTTTKAATTIKPAETSASETEPGLPMSDVPGMTAPGVLPIVTEPVKLTIGLAQNSGVMDYEDNYMTKMIEEETGIDIEFYFFPSTGAEQNIIMMVSANQELPDVIASHGGLSANTVLNFGESGIFLPLDEYFEKYAYFLNLVDITEEERQMIDTFITSPDGKKYGFPSYQDAYADRPQFMWFINMPWLEKLGLDIPKTTDELYAVLKAFKERDPNGNNKPDEIPLISSNGYNGNTYNLIINSFLYYDPDYFFNVEDGKLTVPVITEEYRDALRYIRKLVSEDLYSPLSFTYGNVDLKAMLNLPKEQDTIVGMFGGTTTTLFDVDNEKVFEYEAAPLVEGPNGVKWCPNRIPTVRSNTYITKYCEHPEVAFRLFDYFTEEKRSLIVRYGEPGVHWMYRPDDPEAFDKRFPYKGPVTTILNNEPKYGIIPGVDQPWTTPNKTIWNFTFCSFWPMNLYGGAVAFNEPVATYYGEALEKGMAPLAHRNYCVYKCAEDKIGTYPDEVVTRLIYTEEETQAIAEISTSVRSHVNEARALFCTGGMDIENDWEAYVKNLEGIGLNAWRHIAQTAYDRMYK